MKLRRYNVNINKNNLKRKQKQKQKQNKKNKNGDDIMNYKLNIEKAKQIGAFKSLKQIQALEKIIDVKIKAYLVDYTKYIDAEYKNSASDILRECAYLYLDTIKAEDVKSAKNGKKLVNIYNGCLIYREWNTGETGFFDKFVQEKFDFNSLLDSKIYLLNMVGYNLFNIIDIIDVIETECLNIYIKGRFTFTAIIKKNFEIEEIQNSNIDVKKTIKEIEDKKAEFLKKMTIITTYKEKSNFYKDVRLTEYGEELIKKHNTTQFLKDLEEEMEDFFNYQKAVEYGAKKWGLKPETIEKYDLKIIEGYELDKLAREKTERKEEKDAKKLGDNLYHLKDGGFMIPFNNLNGEKIGYIVRNLDDAAENKYTQIRDNIKNTQAFKKEIDVEFKKGLFLYGADKVDLEKDNTLYIMEGATKVLKVWENTDLNAVALLTSAITKEQIVALKQITNKDTRIVAFLDNEEKGYFFNIKLLLTFKSYGFNNLYMANKKKYFNGAKDEGDYTIELMDKGYTLEEANDSFKDIMYKINNEIIKYNFPTDRQLEILSLFNKRLGLGYTITEIATVISIEGINGVAKLIGELSKVGYKEKIKIKNIFEYIKEKEIMKEKTKIHLENLEKAKENEEFLNNLDLEKELDLGLGFLNLDLELECIVDKEDMPF